ncbi:hypothetical protein ACQ0QQ_00895 [Lysinibacillus sphaericus]
MIDITGINSNSLKEATDKKDVYLIDNNNKRKAGSTTEKIKFGFIDGKDVIERVQSLTSDVLGNRKTITIVEKATFKPVSFSDYINDVQTVKASYGDQTIEIEKKGRLYTKKLSGCYDTFSVEMIIRVLPLRTGYAINFYGFNPVTESEIAVSISVLKKESIKRSSGEFTDTWKVKVYFGETLQYYWVDIVNKELLKQSSRVGDGLTLEFRR